MDIKSFLITDLKVFHESEREWARKNWLFHQVNEQLICFYKFHDGNTEQDGNGFSFVFVQNPHSDREPLFYGQAYFDGVRHLHMGDETRQEDGYLNYPQMDNVIAAMQYLKELQTKFCRDFWE